MYTYYIWLRVLFSVLAGNGFRLIKCITIKCHAFIYKRGASRNHFIQLYAKLLKNQYPPNIMQAKYIIFTVNYLKQNNILSEHIHVLRFPCWESMMSCLMIMFVEAAWSSCRGSELNFKAMM